MTDSNGSSSDWSLGDWDSIKLGSTGSWSVSLQLLTPSSSTVCLEEELNRVGESAKETLYLHTSSFCVEKSSRDYVTEHKKVVLWRVSGWLPAVLESTTSFLQTTPCFLPEQMKLVRQPSPLYYDSTRLPRDRLSMPISPQLLSLNEARTQ